jgi:hypothetical protein
MRFKEHDAVHRLVLWAYLQTAQSAPFEVVLTEWTRAPQRLVHAIRTEALHRFPSLVRCKCTSPTAILNAFAECVQSSAVHIPPMFFTQLPLWLIDIYMSALNVRSRNDAVESDFESVLLQSGEHVDAVRALHRFMLNVLFDSAKECVVVLMCPTPVFKTMSVYMHKVGLRCNATSSDGARCERVATARCGTCKRAFYCTAKCKRADTMHVDECDTLGCGCGSSRRRRRYVVKRRDRVKLLGTAV